MIPAIADYRHQERVARKFRSNYKAMFGWIGGLRRCSVGRHERSEPHVHKVGEHYISKCRYCGVRMRRLAKRNWIVERARDAGAHGVADRA